MGRFDGKVAFITGGARGQGRSHAVALAEGGADIAIMDMCRQLPTVQHSMSTEEDMEETVRLVEKTGRGVLAVRADVRDDAAVADAVGRTLDRFGHIDYVVANAGIMATTGQPAEELQAWRDSIDTMLTGVYYTLRATVPPMVERDTGGSIVITSSTAGLRGVAYDTSLLTPGELGYGSAKHGVLGLMRNYAMALGQHRIRVNCVHPMGVRTPMVDNEFFTGVIAAAPPGWMANAMSLGLIEPRDVSAAVTWLCSDEARYVTGISLEVDAGQHLL